MESISHLRQMMAEQKFFEVQRAVELQLTVNSGARGELIGLYVESLKAQSKNVPLEILIEFAQVESQNNNHDAVISLLSDFNVQEINKNFKLINQLLFNALDIKGRVSELYQLISEFLLHQYETRNPSIPDFVAKAIAKYFKHDFYLKLKILAISLMLQDLKKAYSLTEELIYDCFEHPSPKGGSGKLKLIEEVLKTETAMGPLEIYQSLCRISSSGIDDKGDYKRLVEMVIYFDDFKMQTLVLNLMHQLGLFQESELYAEVLKKNRRYSFVYFDKYFPSLKKYFLKIPAQNIAEEKTEFLIQKEERLDSLIGNERGQEITREYVEKEDVNSYLQFLKYQDLDVNQLCDLATSFLQSEMPIVALKASELIIEKCTGDKIFLKGAYLKLTSLLQMKDYRAALDICLLALSKAQTQNDVLSFMYGQAEALTRLHMHKEARLVLSRILSIDSDYRLAKERLDKL